MQLVEVSSHQLDLEQELKLTEVGPTLLMVGQMELEEFHSTGEGEVAVVEVPPRMMGVETTISHGSLLRKRKKSLQPMLNLFTQMV